MDKIKNFLKKTVKSKSFIPMTVIVVLAIAAIAALLMMNGKTSEPEKTMSAADYFTEAESYFADGSYDNAIASYDKGLLLEETNISALFGKAKSYKELGNTQMQETVLMQAIDGIEKQYKDGVANQDAKEVFYMYADCLLDKNEVSAAGRFLEQENEIVDGLLDGYSNKDKITSDSKAEIVDNGNVLFGTYPQNKLENEEVSNVITDAEYDDNDYALVYGQLYKRLKTNNGYDYYSCSKIEWRIINETDEGYLLMSEYALDAQPFNTEDVESAWNTCSLHAWLTDTFYNAAFNQTEQSELLEKIITPSINPDYGVLTGEDIPDYIAILAAEEVSEGANGFPGTRKDNDETRLCSPTEYAKAAGVYADSSNHCRWWLRTAGNGASLSMYVANNGLLACDGYYVSGVDIGVRPVVYLSKDAVEK